jgi:hypothetical protein
MEITVSMRGESVVMMLLLATRSAPFYNNKDNDAMLNAVSGYRSLPRRGKIAEVRVQEQHYHKHDSWD